MKSQGRSRTATAKGIDGQKSGTGLSRRRLLGGALAGAACTLGGTLARAAGLDYAYIVMDAQTGLILDALEPDRALIPASLAKIPTMAAALRVFGADHRFATGLYQAQTASGPSIHLKGNDPTLDIDSLERLISSAPIMGGDGRAQAFTLDPGPIPRLAQIAPNQPAAAAYNPGIAALALNFNRGRLVYDLAEGRSTNPALAWVSGSKKLPIPGIECAIVDKGRVVPAVERSMGREMWTLPADFGPARELPIGDPLAAIAATTRTLAMRMGHNWTMPELAAGTDGAIILAEQQSGSLDQIIAGCLHYSNNLVAEMLMLSAGHADGSQAKNLAEAGHWLVARLSALYRQIDWQGALLENGSGLGIGSRLSVRQISTLLQSEPDIAALLKPVGPARPYGLRVKTGTLAYIRGLAGRFTTVDGVSRVFAIMAADTPARLALDSIQPPPLDPPPQSRVWLAKAKRNEVELLARWGLPEADLAALAPNAG